MSKGLNEGAKSIIGWVITVGVIALIILILSILFGNLSGNVGFTTTSAAITNDSVTLNDVGITFDDTAGKVHPSLSSVILINESGGETVPATNYTVGLTTITTKAGAYNATSVNVTATLTYDSQGLVDTNNIILNYTTSGTNVTEQLPTVGTIIGVALLLLVLLWILALAINKMMGIGGSNVLGKKSGRSSTDFGDSVSEFA